jgi:hypothetical protein
MNYLTTTLYGSGKDAFVVLDEISCMYDTAKYGVIICKSGTTLKVNMTTSEFVQKLGVATDDNARNSR